MLLFLRETVLDRRRPVLFLDAFLCLRGLYDPDESGPAPRRTEPGAAMSAEGKYDGGPSADAPTSLGRAS